MLKFDPTSGRFEIIRSSARKLQYVSLGLVGAGVVILIAREGSNSIGMFLLFLGFVLHFAVGLRYGVISSNLGFGKVHLTVYKSENLVLFGWAVLAEAIWLVFLLIGLLLMS